MVSRVLESIVFKIMTYNNVTQNETPTKSLQSKRDNLNLLFSVCTSNKTATPIKLNQKHLIISDAEVVSEMS